MPNIFSRITTNQAQTSPSFYSRFNNVVQDITRSAKEFVDAISTDDDETPSFQPDEVISAQDLHQYLYVAPPENLSRFHIPNPGRIDPPRRISSLGRLSPPDLMSDDGSVYSSQSTPLSTPRSTSFSSSCLLSPPPLRLSLSKSEFDHPNPKPALSLSTNLLFDTPSAPFTPPSPYRRRSPRAKEFTDVDAIMMMPEPIVHDQVPFGHTPLPYKPRYRPSPFALPLSPRDGRYSKALPSIVAAEPSPTRGAVFVIGDEEDEEEAESLEGSMPLNSKIQSTVDHATRSSLIPTLPFI